MKKLSESKMEDADFWNKFFLRSISVRDFLIADYLFNKYSLSRPEINVYIWSAVTMLEYHIQKDWIKDNHSINMILNRVVQSGGRAGAGDFRLVSLLSLMKNKGYYLEEPASIFITTWRSCKFLDIITALVELGATPDTEGFTLSKFNSDHNKAKLCRLGFK